MSPKSSSALFELGARAFGKAWVVKSKQTSQKYVSIVIQIKGLSSTALDRCVTEVAVLSACCHANIVQYIEAFVAEGALHIVMEYAAGGDLQEKIERQNGVLFSSETVLDWFLQVVMALEYIHNRNILHRDLKPHNIFLMESGIVKLGDFGIARVLANCDDLASTRIGTPFYISPEICMGKQYNSSSDMWAAGCLLYQMSSLHVPFQASHFDELVEKIVKAEYPPLPRTCSPIISHIISRLILKDPSERLSAVIILNKQELLERVMVLKKRNAFSTGRKGQGHRTRSRSLMTERSRLNSDQRSRSCNRNEAEPHNLMEINLEENSARKPQTQTHERNVNCSKSDNRDIPQTNMSASNNSDNLNELQPNSINQASRKTDKTDIGQLNLNVASQKSDKSDSQKACVRMVSKKSGKSDIRKAYVNDIVASQKSDKSDVGHAYVNVACPTLDKNDVGKAYVNVASQKSDRTDCGKPCVIVASDKSERTDKPQPERNRVASQKDTQNVTDDKSPCQDMPAGGQDIKQQNRRLSSLTYIIPESAMRRLSEASPSLSQTIRKQRFSLSINSPVLALQTSTNRKESHDSDDEVFKKDCDLKKQNTDKDMNNNNNKLEIPGIKSINEVLFNTLAVLDQDKHQAAAVLYDHIRSCLGPESTDQLIQQVKRLASLKTDYSVLSGMISNKEKELFPLMAMYIALRL